MSPLSIRILRQLGLLDRINFTARTRLGGETFKVPVVGGLGADLLVDSEPWMTPVLKSVLLGRNGAFLDVGVNVGQTLLRANSVAKGVRYVGFEPNPDCVSYVSELIRLNRFSNCTIVPAGLFNKAALLSLELPNGGRTDSSASLVPGFRGYDEGRLSRLVCVMDFSTVSAGVQFDSIAAIKIDVEGAELEVLETLAPAVLLTRPPVLLEVLPVYSSENKLRANRQVRLETLVKGWGYRVLRIRKTKDGQFANYESVQSFGVHSDLSMCDYLLQPV